MKLKSSIAVIALLASLALSEEPEGAGLLIPR